LILDLHKVLAQEIITLEGISIVGLHQVLVHEIITILHLD